MFPHSLKVAGIFALFVLTFSCRAQVTVAQDGSGSFNGKDEKPILAALAQVRASGGEIVIGPGIYEMTKALELKDVRYVRIRGLPGAILKASPLEHAQADVDVAVGESNVPVRVQQGLKPGMLLQFHAPGAVDSFSRKPKPTFFVKLAGVEGNRLVLAEPLKFPVPAGTRIVNENAPNLFELRSGCENLTIEGLVIDGGRTARDPEIPAHAQRCGIFASGLYSYTDGPKGPPVRTLTIRDCTIRQCFGRGIALYSVTEALIANCRIEDTLDEAIDFDHFTTASRALDNHIIRCRVGVEMNDANECWVARNRFEDCKTGVIVWRWCKMDDLNVRNQVLDNLFLNIAGNALQFEPGTRGNVARGNIIRGTGRNGVSLSASETVVSGNVIENTAMHGIVVSGDRNEVAGNRVIGAGAGAAQKFPGIRISGAGNRVLENVVRDRAGADGKAEPVSDGGKENVVR